MIHLSASNVADFIKCSKRYYYRINEPEYGLQTQEMVVGNIVHKALELYWNDKQQLEDFCTNKVDELKIDRHGERTIWKCLETFEVKYLSLLKEEDIIEKRFKIPFDTDVLLVGKMDRISDDWIFDWKTGFNLPTNLEADVQSIVYHYAFTKLYNREPKNVILAGLLYGKTIKFEYNELFYKTLFDEVIPTMIERIKLKQYTREGMFNNSCDNCSFLTHCWKS